MKFSLTMVLAISLACGILAVGPFMPFANAASCADEATVEKISGAAIIYRDGSRLRQWLHVGDKVCKNEDKILLAESSIIRLSPSNGGAS